MKKILYILIAFAIVSCGESTTSETEGASDGKALFEENCSICHGDDGKLGAAGAKDLTLSTLKPEEKIAIITNGKGAMSPFKDLMSPEQIKAVGEYLEKLH